MTDEPRGVFAARLRRLMDKYGVPTQMELVRRTGMPQQTVWAILHAEHEPKYTTLKRLQAAIGCTFEELMDD